MFKTGAQVSHPGHGACTVLDKCTLNLTGEPIEYYKLLPYYGSAETVYTPVANAEKIGVRKLVTKDQARELLHTLGGTAEEWHSDTQKKQQRYRSLFDDNSAESLHDKLSAMSALIRQRQQKTLGSTDKTMLENIQKNVLPELAMALDVSMDDMAKKAEQLILQPQ